MKRISDRAKAKGKQDGLFTSYQKGNTGRIRTTHRSNAATIIMESTTQPHNAKKKKEHDDDDGDHQRNAQEQGHEMTPIRKTKRLDAVIQKPAYGPIQEEVPRVPAGQGLEISIEDAIERLGSGPFQRRILIAAGLCFAADSMEILLLSFLAVVLQSEWNLSPNQTATITSSVFAGAMIGTLVLGPLADRIGRRPVFSITAAIICFFGFATAAANSFEALMLCRFLVGLGVGGLTVPFDTLAEFVPSSERGTKLLAIEYFWTAGTLLVPAFAYFSLGEGDNTLTNGWRLFVVLCGLPCLFSTLLGLVYVPESPRWLMTKGRHGKALSILRLAAKRNGLDPMAVFPENILLIDDQYVVEDHCNFCDLFAPEWRRLTLTLWAAWGGLAFVYYGTIIAVTMVFATANDEDPDQQGAESYSFDYAAIFTSASAEIAGTTFIILLVDRVGRIPSQAFSYVAGGCSILILCLLANQETEHRSYMITAAFFARMFFMSASCATWVSTAEVLTTEIRTTGHSAANAVARLSGFFSPYLVAKTTPYPVIGVVLFTLSMTTAFAVWHIPETKGRNMGAGHEHAMNTNRSLDDDSSEPSGSHYVIT